MTSSEREQEFLKRLRATFKIEAEEHIKAISSGILALEKQPGEEAKTRVVESIFRHAHSLKGSARAVDFTAIETICQSLESIFKDFKYKDIPAAPELFDILQRAVDTIDRVTREQPDAREIDTAKITRELDLVKSGNIGIKPAITKETAAPGADVSKPGGARRFTRQGYLISPSAREPDAINKEVDIPSAAAGRLPSQEQQDSQALQESQESRQPLPPQDLPGRDSLLTMTMRVPSKKLDSLLLQAEEMLFMKLAVNRRSVELKETIPLFEELKKQREAITPILKSLRQNLAKMGIECEKVQAYIDYTDSRLKELQSTCSRVSHALDTDQRIFRGMIDTHLEGMRQTLMLPFATITESFPWMVRDLARQKGKDIELKIKGQAIEIDKRILEEMKAPLLHLVRNAVDHGVETPAERIRRDKPAQAVIEIIITQLEGSKVEIIAADDGMGIDPAAILTKALSSGLYTADESERLTADEIMALIFHPEFSTSPIITDLSGRGLGLAIVKEQVEKLGGHITVQSQPGKGTRFRILLQAKLATSRGILVEAARQKFIIPTLHVQQVLRMKVEEIRTVENRETVTVGEKILSFVHLADVLQLPGQQPGPETTEFVRVVVLGLGDREIAFRVDDVLDEEEVLVKGLGKQLSRVRNIAGATILGSGEIVPILNAADLLKSAVVLAGRTRAVAPPAGKPPGPKTRKKSVLVVEDSITSRMLLKNILETAGYQVRVAVDGMEGWLTVKEQSFDLAVLDVEMPGMSGFALTEKIRQDKELKNLPVVLVTAMESREDREKGIDAGADAYIVKSSFDQSNLLQVVRKLI